MVAPPIIRQPYHRTQRRPARGDRRQGPARLFALTDRGPDTLYTRWRPLQAASSLSEPVEFNLRLCRWRSWYDFPSSLSTGAVNTAYLMKTIGIYSLTCLANPYTCAPAQYCALNSNLGAIGCCTATFLGYDGVKSATGCGYGTACLDSTEFFSYCSSTNCALNSFLRWCTSARVPYCVTFVENGYSAFECASVRGLTRYVLASSTEVECATCSLTPTPSPSPTPSPRPNSDRNSPTTTAASPTTTTSSNSGSNPPPAAQDQSTGNALQKESNKIALGVGIGIGVPTFIVGLWALLRLC